VARPRAQVSGGREPWRVGRMQWQREGSTAVVKKPAGRCAWLPGTDAAFHNHRRPARRSAGRAPVGDAASVRAISAEPLSMPQPSHLARPKATQPGAAAGRSTAPDSVQVPLPLSISVYINVYPVLTLADRSWQAAKRSVCAPICSPQPACAAGRAGRQSAPPLQCCGCRVPAAWREQAQRIRMSMCGAPCSAARVCARWATGAGQRTQGSSGPCGGQRRWAAAGAWGVTCRRRAAGRAAATARSWRRVRRRTGASAGAPAAACTALGAGAAWVATAALMSSTVATPWRGRARSSCRRTRAGPRPPLAPPSRLRAATLRTSAHVQAFPALGNP